MDLAAILLTAVLIGGFIAAATAVIAVVGVLQLLRGAGIHREPPISRTSIVMRQREVDARLRARYLQRRQVQALTALPAPEFFPDEGPAATEPVAEPVAAISAEPQPATFIGSFVEEPAG
jgi:hypothetical protein